ncbi:aminotransferase class I/II-fold pyridoxal phosphate-dependent enzyme [Saccharothrix syringae]|uniref:Aminotransferase class I/II-fold pyridoxal phosphate-dependent enzyme n=2 Tax=Saccharothrix syringae TaxID=103733 RepID=A0A5Q0HFK1_SACSY|nr:aminotransferase class I/II-fold pyridoxal phosphate-dependent enzyme [Saccharothrix syringae]
MNETPYPPLPSLRRVVEEGAARLHRYPDRLAGALTAGLARELGVDPGSILVGPGSAGLCQHLVQALGPRPEVVHAALSFEGYPLIVRNAGATAVPVPMDGHGHDLPAMAAAVTARTRCVLVCNPNNPTGAALRRAELVDFLDRVPADVPVVVDEAYRHFVTDPDVPDAMDLYRAYPNVCVLRTFSKAYGLAALRIGYAVVPPALAMAVRVVGMVFFPGSLGQAAALRALEPDVTGELERRCAAVVAARDRLADGLREAGVAVPPSQANFLWLPLGERAGAFAGAARAAGILVAALDGRGVRVTVGSDEANDRFLAFARDHLG